LNNGTRPGIARGSAAWKSITRYDGSTQARRNVQGIQRPARLAVFPYLNVVVPNVMYNPAANAVTIKRGERIMTFYPHVAVEEIWTKS
jgi:ArsR family metal-binding transcriptional regulator